MIRITINKPVEKVTEMTLEDAVKEIEENLKEMGLYKSAEWQMIKDVLEKNKRFTESDVFERLSNIHQKNGFLYHSTLNNNLFDMKIYTSEIQKDVLYIMNEVCYLNDTLDENVENKNV